MKSKVLAIEWCRKAQEDELSLRAVLEDGAPSTACFLAQQMTEKYLKALLVWHGKDFPKMHDLLQLETLIAQIEPGIKRFHKTFESLNRYYIETRYPGDYPIFTKAEGQKAFEEAQKVERFVVSKIEK